MVPSLSNAARRRRRLGRVTVWKSSVVRRRPAGVPSQVIRKMRKIPEIKNESDVETALMGYLIVFDFKFQTWQCQVFLAGPSRFDNVPKQHER